MKFFKEKLKLRIYQQTILATAMEKNTLVVIPTGLGKTYIALGLAGLKIKIGKILFMAPTKPLCEQHRKTFSVFFRPEDELILLTGAIPPSRRKRLWSNKIIFATPQTVENDILRRYLNLKEFSLIIFDEAHRAIGDYDYTWIAKQYNSKNPNGRILALTASPASEKEKIQEVCDNLFIKKIEVRQESDLDVGKFIKNKSIKKIDIILPEEMLEIKKSLENVLKLRLRKLKSLEAINSIELKKIRKVQLLKLQGRYIKEASENPSALFVISILASTIKVLHALELLQTQGVYSLNEFFSKIKQQATRIKASKNLLNDWNFKKAMILANNLVEKNIEHPKFEVLNKIILNNIKPHSRIIIFTQYRSSVDKILQKVSMVIGARPAKFIGQKEGMSQKKQIKVLEQFKDGIFNILICTNIGEEGLHIENADIGIFFEPVPSALRSIQRRGRIGRVNIGEIYTLVTKDTIDENYYWVALHKERKMNQILTDLKNAKPEQTKLID